MDRCYDELTDGIQEPGQILRSTPSPLRFLRFLLGSFVLVTRPHRREPLWAVTDETMCNWLKQVVKRAGEDSVYFSISVTPHMLRHSYTMHTLYHRQYRTVIQAMAGLFSGDGRDAAEILQTLPPLK